MLELIGALVTGFLIGGAIGLALIAILETLLAIGRGIRRVWWWATEMAEIAYYHITRS